MNPLLKNSVVAPRPSPAQIEFFLSARGGVGIVKTCRSKDHPEFAEEFIQDVIAVGEAGKLNPVAVHIAHRRHFAGDDEFSKDAKRRRIAAEELNQRVRILQGS